MREKDDFYPTPPVMTEALLAYEFLEPCRVHEPACGNGAMSKVLRCYGHEVVSEDLIDRGYGDSRRDFLMLQKRPCDYLMTNPPYKLAEEFIQRALDLEYKRHAYLLRLGFLEGMGRYDRLYSKHPFDVCYVFSKRQTIWRGDEEATSTGTVQYAWFVWDSESTKQRMEWI